MWTPLRATCLCASLALTAAGCGGGAEDPPDNPGSARSGAELRVTAEEYVFDPNRVAVRGGAGPLKITLANRGDLAHNIKVFEGEREIGGLQSFPGGQERSTTVRLARGEYKFICSVGDHEDLGMRGTFKVR